MISTIKLLALMPNLVFTVQSEGFIISYWFVKVFFFHLIYNIILEIFIHLISLFSLL